MKIGVGVTVHNRHDIAIKNLVQWGRFLPPDGVLVVVDDASDTPVPNADFRFNRNVGIARAKNKALELLEDQGVTEFFLADDDVYPLTEQWWKPYVSSPEPHLMRIFPELRGDNEPLNDITFTYADGTHTAWTGARGCLLYANLSVLQTVGGMNPEYGRWGYEHVDWSRRIFNANLTSLPFMDVIDSDQLIYCQDEWVEVDRSVPDRDRERLNEHNAELYSSYLDADHFVPYRSPKNAVITTLLTKQIDPARNIKWEPNPEILRTLLDSLVSENQEVVVINDEVGNSCDEFPEVFFVLTSSGINPYFQRWFSIFGYLRDHPELDLVWCVDGSDVTLLRLPWPHMRHDTLYVGSEPVTLNTPWLRAHHRDRRVHRLIDKQPTSTLLNAGLIGGSRQLVMDFAQDMMSLWQSNASRRFWGTEMDTLGVGDMGAFNLLGYSEKWKNRIEFGSHINTEFKSYSDNGEAWWMHK